MYNESNDHNNNNNIVIHIGKKLYEEKEYLWKVGSSLKIKITD